MSVFGILNLNDCTIQVIKFLCLFKIWNNIEIETYNFDFVEKGQIKTSSRRQRFYHKRIDNSKILCCVKLDFRFKYPRNLTQSVLFVLFIKKKILFCEANFTWNKVVMVVWRDIPFMYYLLNMKYIWWNK